MTKHAFLILIFGGILFAIMARACAHPAASDVRGRAYVPWIAPMQAPAPCDYRRDVWPCWVATMTAAAAMTPTPTRASATWEPAYPEPRMGVWTWVDVAVARAADDAGKPTAAPTPTRTGAPTPTRPPRATRTPHATGTPTQSGMATVPACGCDTPEPGPGTRFPGCWPYGGTCAPTDTPAPTASDTPPATATWEPTPTPRVKVSPAAGGWVPVPTRAAWVGYYPMVLVRRAR